MKTDYPELEGIIVSMDPIVYTSLRGKVIGCCYNVGITIVNVDDPNDKLLCLNYNNIKEGKSIFKNLSEYRVEFYRIIKNLKLGKYVGHNKSKNSNMAPCAFGA